ncbi:MAG: LysM peptidoglycan-binding domain-containing protein, partial [Legionella sp.]
NKIQYPVQVANKKAATPSVLPKKELIKNSPIYQNQPLISHQNPIKARHSPSSPLRSVIVVLDAGHGGKDPGAKGPHRTQEKDVVLAITLKLKRLIDSQPGMRAVLTRNGDYYVGLRERLDIARKYNGDIFIAIHADAFNNPLSNGASVFALSQRGATSEAARWIAEKENYSELGGVNLGDLDDQNGVVRSVLIDLSQTATINSSLQMGGRVLSQLGQFARLHNTKVEQARFMVLKSPDIPSILVETGFISNPREEKNLTSSGYQDRISRAIFQGIKGYFWENPPHGTRIEAMTSSNFHLVRSGESMQSIAARYHVTVSALQAMNNLNGHPPRPGQKLVIPSIWA